MKVSYTEPIFCPVDHYTCMMPVEYQKSNEDRKYHKHRMVCHCVLEGKCTNETSCDHFIQAPEIAEYYLLKDR